MWLTAADGETLRYGDGQLLGKALNTEVTEQVYAPVDISFGKQLQSGIVVGCSSEYMTVMDSHIQLGRELYALEWQAGSRSLLMGTELAQEMGVEPGKVISLSGIPFYVRGIVEQRNELSQVNASRAVFMPVEVFCELMGREVHEITLSVPDGMKPQAIAAMAQDIMRLRRNVEVQAITMQVQIEAANSVMAIFVDVLKWVALICILVGGIGVMNILLVSVRERRREIGVMKSLGTTQTQICLLFLFEALIYAMVGGTFGLLIGVALIETAGRSIGLQPVIQVADCAAVFTAAVAVGLIFGVSPASRASKMRPVDALRDE